MAKVFIQIELDSSDTQTPELLIALSNAFLNTKAAVEVPAVKNQVEEPAYDGVPKATVKKTKKVVKAEEPVAEEPVAEEPKWEPGGGLVADETEKTEEAPEENFTVDDVRTAMAEAKRSGKDSADLRAILKTNGAAIVSDLDPKKFAAVIKAVKAL